MIYTARQLEELHKAHGQLVLPYGARLTPLAVDWTRSRKIVVGYSDVQPPKVETRQVDGAAAKVMEGTATAPKASSKPLSLLWWCDGPCGAAKAGLSAVSKEANTTLREIAIDPKRSVEVVKLIAKEVKAGTADGGVLLVQHAATAMIYANRCLSLRAVLGTSHQAVDQGVQLVAANVLVIEYVNKTFPQIKNLLSRFVRGSRLISDDVKRELAELSSCG